MKTNNLSFPHPVLRPRQGTYDEQNNYDDSYDDITPALTSDSVKVNREEDGDDAYIYTITLNQENSFINTLIKAGKAVYACEVTCPSAYFRMNVRSDNPKCVGDAPNILKVRIDRHRIQNVVEFNCYIALLVKFNYNNPNANPMYSNTVFPLEPGDLLAIFPTATDLLDISEEDLYIGSAYMQIMEDANATYPEVDLSAQKINIKLPTTMYHQYGKLARNEYNVAVHASLVFNALIEALRNCDNTIYETKLWSRCLKARLAETDLKNIDLQSHLYEAANRILENPIKRMFDSFCKPPKQQ